MERPTDCSEEELDACLDTLRKEHAGYCARNLSLNMARGKPSAEQLELSEPMLRILGPRSDFTAEDGTDCRNYGALYGIPEARRFMGAMMDEDPDNVFVCGSSSLNAMYDYFSRCFVFGQLGGTPWSHLDEVKWICPVPGYDRHFNICESFGVTMVPVALGPDGPDMDAVEKLVAHDASIKGIWCVPKYSNPTGTSYSDDTVRRLASMPCAAEDFRIFWDNAYVVHHLYDEPDMQDGLLDIAGACELAGTPDRYVKFASLSKITFPGASISAFACSKANLEESKRHISAQTIGFDKLNQLRHVRFLADMDGLAAHMSKHARILRPKFELVTSELRRNLDGWNCSWTEPRGGYFISFAGPAGTAKRIVGLAKEAGVTLTAAGAPFPHGNDPDDSVIRIAPSLPPIEELQQAMEVFVCCVKITCLEKLLQR